jgi:hypothetical protein
MLVVPILLSAPENGVTGTVSGAFSANGQTHDFTMIYTRQ